MPLFAASLSCLVLILSSAFALAGKSHRARYARVEAVLVAQHSTRLKLFALLGYCIVSSIPLLFPLRMGDPLMDRLFYLLVHGAFFVGILAVWNQAVVIGERQVLVSTMFGAVRVVDSADLAGARIERHEWPVRGTLFVTRKGTIWVDDEMQHGAQAAAVLTGRTRSGDRP